MGLNVKKEVSIINEQEYNKMLFVIDDYYEDEFLIIQWENGLVAKCLADFGINESSTEPGDEDYIGEYYTVVKIIEILKQGTDESVPIYNDDIEISLINIPQKISLEDGSVLWQRDQ